MSTDNVQPPQKKKDLVEAVEALQKADQLQDAAQSLREKAINITDSRKREQLIRDAYEKEIEAHGQSKLARRLQSGTWQGLAGGTGIGAGVGVGVGTVSTAERKGHPCAVSLNCGMRCSLFQNPTDCDRGNAVLPTRLCSLQRQNLSANLCYETLLILYLS